MKTFSSPYILLRSAWVTSHYSFKVAANGIFVFGLTWETKYLWSSWDLKVICNVGILSFISFSRIHGIAFKHFGWEGVLDNGVMLEEPYVFKGTHHWCRISAQRREKWGYIYHFYNSISLTESWFIVRKNDNSFWRRNNGYCNQDSFFTSSALFAIENS